MLDGLVSYVTLTRRNGKQINFVPVEKPALSHAHALATLKVELTSLLCHIAHLIRFDIQKLETAKQHPISPLPFCRLLVVPPEQCVQPSYIHNFVAMSSMRHVGRAGRADRTSILLPHQIPATISYADICIITDATTTSHRFSSDMR